MSIITSLLLTLFATLTPTSGDLSDLCDIVHPDTGTPLRCSPQPEGAPLYGGTVCCDDTTCFESEGGPCLDGEVLYSCELGKVSASKEVACFFEVPTYCEVFPCDPGYQTQPQANPICCNNGVCWNIFGDGYDCEFNDIYWCDDGVTNQDGTVTCFD